MGRGGSDSWKSKTPETRNNQLAITYALIFNTNRCIFFVRMSYWHGGIVFELLKINFYQKVVTKWRSHHIYIIEGQATGRLWARSILYTQIHKRLVHPDWYDLKREAGASYLKAASAFLIEENIFSKQCICSHKCSKETSGVAARSLFLCLLG